MAGDRWQEVVQPSNHPNAIIIPQCSILTSFCALPPHAHLTLNAPLALETTGFAAAQNRAARSFSSLAHARAWSGDGAAAPVDWCERKFCDAC